MELCGILLSWVLSLSAYSDVQGCPEMRPVSHDWLESQACEGRSCRVLGWYPGEGDVVYLDEGLDMDNTVHVSIAVHEIVHWVQKQKGALRPDCASSVAAEREAYHIQREYLTAYGTYYPTGRVMPRLRCDPE